MSASQSPPAYGAIDHYLGDKGREYFGWQGAAGIEQERYNRFIWEPHIQSTDDVLDFGCGGGYLLSGLTARRKVGVEVNPHALDCARGLGLEAYANLADVPGVFDKVITSHAVEHVPHPRQAFLELKEKLRDPHSRLLVLLPLDDWRTAANRRFHPNDMHMHLHAWTPSSLGNLLKTCDLEVLDVRVIAHAWPPASRHLWRISPSQFHLTARVWSRIRRMRQLFAITSLKS
jgi:SAM-dependent methyltransferase